MPRLEPLIRDTPLVHLYFASFGLIVCLILPFWFFHNVKIDRNSIELGMTRLSIFDLTKLNQCSKQIIIVTKLSSPWVTG